jgi:hypothetical protein
MIMFLREPQKKKKKNSKGVGRICRDINGLYNKYQNICNIFDNFYFKFGKFGVITKNLTKFTTICITFT